MMSKHGFHPLRMQERPQLYSYLDYRKFVSDIYEHKKSLNPRYSYAVFAKKGLLLSRSYIRLVIGGRRNLTLSSTFKFARALELSTEETQYFQQLVALNQAGGSLRLRPGSVR